METMIESDRRSSGIKNHGWVWLHGGTHYQKVNTDNIIRLELQGPYGDEERVRIRVVWDDGRVDYLVYSEFNAEKARNMIDRITSREYELIHLPSYDPTPFNPDIDVMHVRNEDD